MSDAAPDDRATFEDLYELYVDRVYAYLRARTANEDDAADLTQQVFVQALAALAQYHPHRGSFAAWLFRIARNAATDFQRHHRIVIPWESVPEKLYPPADCDPADAVLDQEAVTRLRALFTQLDADTRDVLLLRFDTHLTIAEIAAVIGKSEAATQKKLFRVIQTLKEQYHDDRA